jgi:PAS domain S-box-containing protein
MPVLEIAQVAQALESARTDLLQTLTSLQSERDWSEHLLASIVEGIVTLDAKGRITFFSHGAERITGWSKNEVLGRACEEVFQLVNTEDPFTKRVPAPGKRAKVDVLLAGGKEASLAITRAEFAPTGAAFAEIALVFRDISEEEAVHRLLGHFLANVAHEFRTPLSALAASIELLLDQAPELSRAELNELLLSLHLGTLGLQTLVDNLLESASIEAGHFRISPRTTDLGKIIADSFATMRPLLEKYGQRLALELPSDIPLVRADPRRTVQVLVNLISNASKYGPVDAEIILRVNRTGTEARVEVIDQGAGINSEARANLFRRFVYPTEDYDHSPPGAGLGLSVVKTIVEAHGGRVGVDDNPRGGSIFWFTLPVIRDES